MHKKAILFLLILVLTSSVEASKEADWLIGQSNQNSWNSIRETAYSILALKQETGYNDIVLNASRNLITSLETCMATNSCNVNDVAVAVFALNEIGGNAIIVNTAGTWLLNSRNIIFTGELPTAGNEWFVQVVSNVAGSCVLNNLENGVTYDVPVTLSSGYVPWFNIDSSILTAATESLNLDCSSLGSNPVLSLINKKNIIGIDNYFIKQEEHSRKNITVNFGNPCWGQNYRDGSCNTAVTGRVLYTLNKIGKSGDPSWLRGQTNLGLKEKAFLFKITGNAQYLNDLAQEKNSAGFWGAADLETTSLIYSLLKPNPLLNGVNNWVASRRHGDGCWPKPTCNVEQTGLVLYSGSYQPSESGCADLDKDGNCDSDDNDLDGDGLLNNIDPFPRNPDQNNNGILDGDEDLDRDGHANKEDTDIDGDGVLNESDRNPFDETIGRPERTVGGDSTTIGNICTTLEGCEGRRDAIGQCIDISGDGCPVSDTGSRSPDVSGTPSTGTAPTGPSEKLESEGSSVLLWSLMVLLLFIILIGGGFLAYKKGLLKFKRSKVTPTATYTPKIGHAQTKSYHPRIASSPRKKLGIPGQIEKELDQSMKDLERLLGKK